MSLFNSKEPEKNVKPQSAPTPQIQPVQPAPVTLPVSAAVEAKPINNNSSNANAKTIPVTPINISNSTAYLDAGSRISGKLYFETSARIDGQVEGEINSKDSLAIGESAVVSAQIKADSVVVAGKVSGD